MSEIEIKIRIICAVLTGRTSNPDFSNLHISTILDEAIQASDLILDDLKVRNHLSPQSPSQL